MEFCPFRKFKNALGIPKKGVHAYRLINTAVVDYILTILIAITTSYITHIPLVLTTIGWFVGGLILHILFDVQTNTLKWLGVAC